MLKGLLIIPIKAYQMFISPFIGGGCGCRYMPTCSHYAEEAITRHGIFHGSIMTIKRLLKCNPFGGSGYDPVPEKGE